MTKIRLTLLITGGLLIMLVGISCAKSIEPRKVRTATSVMASKVGLNPESGSIPNEILEYAESGYLKKLTSKICASDTLCFLIVAEYDSLGNEIFVQRQDNGVTKIETYKYYNSENALISELRYEYDDEGADTFRYEYVYLDQEDGTGRLVFLVNNGDTVTRNFIEENDSMRIEVLETYPDDTDDFIETTETKMNASGKPLEKKKVVISSDRWDGKDPDTTVYLVKYEYDKNGLKTLEESYRNDKFEKRLRIKYENVYIAYKTLTKNMNETILRYEYTYFE